MVNKVLDLEEEMLIIGSWFNNGFNYQEAKKKCI
jgi:hypothetical protein